MGKEIDVNPMERDRKEVQRSLSQLGRYVVKPAQLALGALTCQLKYGFSDEENSADDREEIIFSVLL